MPADEEGGSPEPLLVLQVSDEDAARDGIQALIDCGAEESESPEEAIDGIAFVGDYALLAASQDKADDFADDAEDESLADSDAFTADMEALDGEGVASFWVDLDAADELRGAGRPRVGRRPGGARLRRAGLDIRRAAGAVGRASSSSSRATAT